MGYPKPPSSGKLPGKSAAAAPAPVKKAAPAAAKSAAKAAAPAAAAAKKSVFGSSKNTKDMTWGGRPDPTPEIVVDETPSFLSAAWRYGRK